MPYRYFRFPSQSVDQADLKCQLERAAMCAELNRGQYRTECIVCHPYRFIYVTMYKAACTTIKHAILDLVRGAEGSTWNPEFDMVVHARSKQLFQTRQTEILHSFDAAKSRYPDYFTFTFVREPADRVLSCYRNKVAPHTTDKYLVDRFARIRRGMRFCEFLTVIQDQPLEIMDFHYRPQYTFFDERIDFVGRMESLERDWEVVTERANLPRIPLGFYNVTTSEGAEVDVPASAHACSLIGRIYERDYTTFSYPQPIPNESSTSPIENPILVLGMEGAGLAAVSSFLDQYSLHRIEPHVGERYLQTAGAVQSQFDSLRQSLDQNHSASASLNHARATLCGQLGQILDECCEPKSQWYHVAPGPVGLNRAATARLLRPDIRLIVVAASPAPTVTALQRIQPGTDFQAHCRYWNKGALAIHRLLMHVPDALLLDERDLYRNPERWVLLLSDFLNLAFDSECGVDQNSNASLVQENLRSVDEYSEFEGCGLTGEELKELESECSTGLAVLDYVFNDGDRPTVQAENLNDRCVIGIDPMASQTRLHPNPPSRPDATVTFRSLNLAQVVSMRSEAKGEMSGCGALLRAQLVSFDQVVADVQTEVLPGSKTAVILRVPRKTRTADLALSVSCIPGTQGDLPTGVQIDSFRCS